MPEFAEWPRQKIVRAATRAELELEIKRMEETGWKCQGSMAIARAVDRPEPEYWSQAMAHPSPGSA